MDISKREFYAGLAMLGYLAASADAETAKWNEESLGEMAKISFKAAEAMVIEGSRVMSGGSNPYGYG